MKASRLHASQLSGSRVATLCWFVRWPSTYRKDICSAKVLWGKTDICTWLVTAKRKRWYHLAALVDDTSAKGRKQRQIHNFYFPKVGSKGKKLERTSSFFKRRMAPRDRQFSSEAERVLWLLFIVTDRTFLYIFLHVARVFPQGSLFEFITSQCKSFIYCNNKNVSAPDTRN